MAVIDQNMIRTKVKNFIVETFLIGDSKGTLKDSDSFMQNGIVDSTGVLELTSFIESEYSITVEDNEMVPDNLDSIDNLTAFITKKMG
ncbi:MAG: acyl carrier protein [candidate division Zixibacteria bacterium]|nr:acyl carrier protein [candidate division Zixibacteria bacterium]